MKKPLSPGKWIRLFFICALVLIVLMASIMYIVDPFFQFRVKDNSYMLNPRYVNPGLIKNYDYDTLIIGSSMTQNFDMDIFRQELGVKPLHVSLGGISPLETMELMDLAAKSGKAQHYYICVDLHSFGSMPKDSTNPDYLFSSGALSTAKYLLSYEAWFRFLPVDIAFTMLNAIDIELPPKFAMSTSIDALANWENDFIYDEDNVLSIYKSSAYAVSEVEPAGFAERLEGNLSLLLASSSQLDGDVTFFFPPYSALYWYSSDEYIDLFLSAKEDFIARACEQGFTVFDFQSSPLCCDLNNYRDSTHYSGEVNDWMTRCFASGEYLVTPDTAAEFQQALRDNIPLFFDRYKDKLN